MIPLQAHEEILKQICASITVLDNDKTLSLVNQALKQKVSPHSIIQDGLCRGMQIVGKKCESGEIFFPQLVEFSKVMDGAFKVLKPFCSTCLYLPDTTIVMGVIQGDIHDIGKNILKSTLTYCGFRIMDLGKDVPPMEFVGAAIKEEADVICISTSLSTTMAAVKEVLALLKKQGIKDRVKVVVGGEPVCGKFAKQIGADGYAPNAAMAADLLRSLFA